MSIQPTTPFKNDFPHPALNDTAASTPAPFVRIAKGNTSSSAVHAHANPAPLPMRASTNAITLLPAGPMARWRGSVLGACDALDLKPGEQKILIVRKDPGPAGPVIEKPMVLRLTSAGDAYVFQTPEESLHRPFQGLHLNRSLQMRHNMELIPLAPTHPQYNEANQQFLDLSDALGVPRSGLR